ncbi:hypothetical protein G7Z17_g11392 [Cylindrodendrum hubeiense]|uniref:Pentatricopeptide repeat domain-containing protein n=1 Tax=Cylindrodendrum hubeiense TaxID=595255 RepID=A0A9P5L3Z7_9HYPO|nr:hypothetical protein G7Z17_g11392 [Cylindrodendrum hubeiense]
MQSLWSRAGQAHRCGCRVCDTAVSALGRRVTTATTRPRKPTFAEAFTACYSTMFASAAVVDAIRKEDRSRDLDRQLEDARRELAEAQLLRAMETDRITGRLDVDQPVLTSDQMEELWASLKEVYTSRPFMKESYKPVTLSVSELLTRLHEDHYHKPDWPTMRKLRQTDYERIELAILAEEVDASLPRREVKTRAQLHADSRTIVHLIRQLLKRAHLSQRSGPPSPSYDEASLMVKRFTQPFTFATIDPEAAQRNRSLLNQQLREIISSPTLGLKEMVGRVCYNLLVAPYLPDMHTYNTLIVTFDKTGHKNLAESLVNSFFYKRRLIPTPSTFVAIVNHYKKSNNAWRFLRTVACITGLDAETGAKVGRRLVEEIEQYQTSKEWRTGKGTTLNGDWVYKNLPLDQPLVEAIIKGLLHFNFFDQAAVFMVSCMKASVSLNTKIVQQVFDECILALDWRAALRLVRGFTDRPNGIPLLILNRGDDVAYLVSRIRVLIDVCGLSPGQRGSKSALASLNISSTKFSQFLEALDQADATSALNMDGSSNNLALFEPDQVASSLRSRLLQIESMFREQKFVEKTTRGIESKLMYPDFSMEFRISMAFHIGESTTKRSLVLNQEYSELLTPRIEQAGIKTRLRECEDFHKSIELSLENNIDLEQNMAESLEKSLEEQVNGGVALGTGEAAMETQPDAGAPIRAEQRKVMTEWFTQTSRGLPLPSAQGE